MTTTLEIIGAVRSLLLPVHPRVWPERAPDGAAYPYLVINLPNSVDMSDTEVFVLDVDGWDVPADGSPAALEVLMGKADRALNWRTALLPGQLAMTFYRDTRLSLEDDDPRIRRRKYIYQVRTHTGGAM